MTHTYYVDPKAGDDDNDASQSAPVKTFTPLYNVLDRLTRPARALVVLWGMPDDCNFPVPPGVSVTVHTNGHGNPVMFKRERYNCYEKAESGEPKFTLIGRDPAAAVTIQFWHAVRSQLFGIQDEDQLDEAVNLRDKMDAWAAERKGKKELCTEAFEIAKELAPRVFGG